MKLRVYLIAVAAGVVTVGLAETARAQMRDTLEKISGNAINEGIHKNIGGQIGDRARQHQTPDSSISSFSAIRSAPCGAAGSSSSASSCRRRASAAATASGQHRGRRVHRRRPRRFVRRLPRPPARLGRASAATSSRVPTAATRRTCSASACRRCWATRSPPICAPSAPRRSAAPSTGSRRRCRWPQRASTTAPSRRIPNGTVRHHRRRRRECRSARASVLRAGRHDLDPRVPGRRVQRRDGDAVAMIPICATRPSTASGS